MNRLQLMKGHPRLFLGKALPPGHDFYVLRHELRNVLNGMFGMSARLRDHGRLDQEQLRWLEAIESSARQVASLIEAYGPQTMAGSGSLRPRPGSFDGIDLLGQVLTGNQPGATASGHRLLLVASAELPRFWRSDGCLVRQVLDNLVVNAIRYARPGDIVLEATSLEKRPDCLVLRLVDPGCDDMEMAGDWMFQAYQRGEGVRESERIGSGLGLFVCRGIASALGGEIRCRPATDDGTCFEFVLPGALKDSKPSRSPATVLYSHLHVDVALEGAALRSVVSLLDRLGVERARAGQAAPKHRLSLLVRTGRAKPVPGDGTGPAPLELATRDPAGREQSVFALPEPVLESTLGPALLRMVFEWRDADAVLRGRKAQSEP